MAAQISNSQGRSMSFVVERTGQRLTVDLAPELKTTQNLFGEDVERYVIDIRSAGDVIPRELSLMESVQMSVARTWEITELTVLSVVKLIQGKLPAETLGGPIKIAEMAGALFESLIMNHGFVDGNKRVAFFATDVFLRLNGYKLKVEAKKAHRFLIGLLENDRCNFDELLPWIRKHAMKL